MLYLGQKLKQLDYICTIYKDNKEKKVEQITVKKKIAKIKCSKLV